jgi:divalent metal cation (Fe/Co/Zn/Cd) transporter
MKDVILALLILFLLKFLVGYFTKTTVLITDALHTLVD